MLLSIEGLKKYYGADLVLDGVTAALNEGDRVGIIGPNGSGKTTLLNIIDGRERYEEGAVIKKNGLKIGYLTQSAASFSEGTVEQQLREVFADVYAAEERMKNLSARMATATGEELDRLTREYAAQENYFLSRDGYHTEVKIKTVASGMGFLESLGQEAAVLSGGEKTRLMLCRLLLAEPDVLLLDEPTNHLDFYTLMWLEDYLKTFPGAVIVVSHDRYFLDKVAGRIWDIRFHTLTEYRGNYSSYVIQKAERDERYQKEYEQQQREIAAMEDYVRRNIVRATTADRAKSRVKALERMERIEPPKQEGKKAHFAFRPGIKSHKEVLEVKEAAVAFGGDSIFDHVNLSVVRGDHVAIVGRNGAGKSTLLRALCGQLELSAGEAHWGGATKVSFYDQEMQTLHKEKTLFWELLDRFPALSDYEVRALLGQVLFSGEEIEKRVGDLSGGEKARLLMAVIMQERANVLLLDEPTNHLDLETREQLEKGLLEFDGTLIFVSHDRYFINKLARRTVEVTPGGLVSYEGGFDSFYEAKTAAAPKETERTPERPKSNEEKSYYRSKEERAREAKRKKRIREMEELMAQAEQRMKELEEAMQSPEGAADYVRLSEWTEELGRTQELSEQYFEEWARLCEEDGE